MKTPFSRGTGTFNLFGAGNYFDNNKNGVLDGAVVPYDTLGYPGIAQTGFKAQPFAYPAANPVRTAVQAYQYVIDSVGATYPRRDQVDNLMIDEVKSKGTKGLYVYNETDLPFANGGLGVVFNAPRPPRHRQRRHARRLRGRQRPEQKQPCRRRSLQYQEPAVPQH